MRFASPEMAVVRRELLTVLRKKRTFLALLLMIGLATGFVMRDWPIGAGIDLVAGRGAQLSDSLSRMLALALLAGGLLTLTPLAGAAITTERENGTLPMLRMALLQPRGIVLAKLVNLMGFYTLLAVGSLPVFGLIFFLVGVSWEDLLLRLTVVYATVFSAVACGLYCSARFSRTITSVIASFVAMIALNGLIVLVVILAAEVIGTIYLTAPNAQGTYVSIDLQTRVFAFADAVAHRLPFLIFGGEEVEGIRVFCGITTPFYYLMENFFGKNVGAVGVYASIWQGFLGLVFLGLAQRRLARLEDVVRLPKGPRIVDAAALHQRRRRFPYYLIDPLKAYPPIPDGQNPVMVKELRWGMIGRMTTLVRMGYLMFLLDLIVVSYFALDIYMAQQTMHTAGLFVIGAGCLFAPLLLANIFTKEYEQDNIDMLRMTLVRPPAVTLGKLLGGALAILPLIIPGAVLLAVVGVLYVVLRNGVMGLVMALVASITLAVLAWCCLNLSLAASLLTRRTTSAFLLSYTLCVLILVVPGPLVVAGRTWYIENIMPREDFTNNYPSYRRDGNWLIVVDDGRMTFEAYLARAERNAVAWSPFTAYVALSGSPNRYGSYPGPMGPRLAVWAVSMVVFLLVGLITYVLAVRLFTHRFLPG